MLPLRRALLSFALLLGAAAHAQFPEKEPYLGLAGGLNAALAPWDLAAPGAVLRPQSGPVGAARLGFQLNQRLAFELGAGYLPQAAGPLGSNAALAYDLTVLYHLVDNGWSPFVLGGAGAYHSPGGDLGSDFDPQVNVGVGFRGMVLPWLALRAQVRDVISDGLRLPSNNLEFTLGVDMFPASLGRAFDRDQDGVADAADRCPDVAGTASTQGCPDADQDGLADAEDACRLEAGPAATKGCPDKDRDGLADAADACPDAAGPEATKGCPDADGDRVADQDDACPKAAGPAALKGCPDTDGDGLIDPQDQCPALAGVASAQGCPDADGDGVQDAQDKCPQASGPKKTQGCPDRDRDGVVDAEDKCPDQAGTVAEHGCLPKELRKFSGAIQGIQFATGKADILKSSFPVLDSAAEVLKKFPTLSLKVEGHTDNDGKPEINHTLSHERAEAVKNYLVKKGVDAARLESEGYGETKPVADNKTAAGRAKNRRVEFKVLGQ